MEYGVIASVVILCVFLATILLKNNFQIEKVKDTYQVEVLKISRYGLFKPLKILLCGHLTMGCQFIRLLLGQETSIVGIAILRMLLYRRSKYNLLHSLVLDLFIP